MLMLQSHIAVIQSSHVIVSCKHIHVSATHILIYLTHMTCSMNLGHATVRRVHWSWGRGAWRGVIMTRGYDAMVAVRGAVTAGGARGAIGGGRGAETEDGGREHRLLFSSKQFHLAMH